MPQIIYVEHDGTEHPTEVDNKMSLMEGATLNMVPGIDAVCGGMCSCATCHCYIDDQQGYGIKAPDEEELDVLDSAVERKETSRLSCQVEVSDALDGLRVNLPSEQA